MRIEKERKEEDRRKYRPVFSVECEKNVAPKEVGYIYLDDLENINKIATQNNESSNLKIQPIFIDNSSKIEFYIYGFQFDNVFYPLPEKRLIRKDRCYIVGFYKSLRFTQNYEIFICIEDLIENKYSTKLNTVIKNNSIIVSVNSQLQPIGEQE